MDVKDAFNPAVNLAWGDVAVDNRKNPQMIRKKSKCNQFEVGSDIIVGRTGSSLCRNSEFYRGDSPVSYI